MRTILGQRPAFDRYEITELADPEVYTAGETYATAMDLTIVAMVTKGIDWAAYYRDATIGGGIEEALNYGDKLPEAAARALFPGIAERYRL